MLKVLHLEAEKAKLSKKLIGLKFNMEYFKSTTLEAYDFISNCEWKFQALNHEVHLLVQKVCQLFYYAPL